MKTVFLTIAFFSLVFIFKIDAQDILTENTTPPFEVARTFEKIFPKEIPKWSKDYEGQDHDQLIYRAKFKTATAEGLAVFDNVGNLKVYEFLIPIKDIPANAIRYLNDNYLYFTITEAAKTIESSTVTTYEVGIVRDHVFYDVVFDHDGNFLEIVEKD
ncbi:hypothetical protein ACRASX_09740 [Flavobacterium sp. TMP13]|uniref:hypothetical protein n=1 Tax=Flavobacterium sp. TMP13 TaxID=3425950 RepID=UPI003D76D361